MGSESVSRNPAAGMSLSDRIDAVVTHRRVWGVVIFLALMAIVFQAMFSWAQLPMDMIRGGVRLAGSPHGLGDAARRSPGPDRPRRVAGVAAVVAFLPQILFLFLFWGSSKTPGLGPRGVHHGESDEQGRPSREVAQSPCSVVSCAIPGIIATRTMTIRATASQRCSSHPS